MKNFFFSPRFLCGLLATLFVAGSLHAANQSPRVSLTAPANNAKLIAPATVLLKATATDADGTVANVEFFTGVTKLGESTVAPYQYNWTPVGPGAYPLTARATDNLGGVTTSAAINLIVNAAPSVVLTAPSPVDSFNAPASVVLKATATDTDGTVTKVEFYRGTTKLGQATVAPFQFTWTGVPAGTFALTAKATDNLGAATTSAPVSITINAPPKIALTSPTAATKFVAPATVLIKATPTDTDGSIAKVEFFRGATKLGEATAAPYQWSWASVSPGSHTLTAKATDNRGATATSAAVTILVNAPPSVALSTPGLTGTLVAPATLTLAATANDPDGTIAKVEFFRGATKLGETLTAPYTFNWTAVAAGSYTLTAKATDNLGATTTSAAIMAVVDAPPRVAITAPTVTSKLVAPASIVIKATASDTDGTVARVEFYSGQTKLGQVSTAPYQFTWAPVAAGSYTLTARAVDNSGAVTTSAPVTIFVNAPPSVALTAPAAGLATSAPASLILAATASDPDGTVAKVEFYRGTVKLGESTTAPYTFNWTNIAAGSYALTARATDNLGAITVSAPVALVVNALPKITLTAPLATAKFNAPATVPLKASASDSDGTLTKVEFFNGAAKLGESTTAPYQFNWTAVSAGTYSLTAAATDNRGAVTISPAVLITVNALPTVTLTAPLSGTVLHAPATTVLSASASDPDGTVAKIEFFRGTTKLGEATTAPYQFTWTQATAGTFAVTARVTDNAGATTTSAPVSIVVNALPKVSITAPVNNAKVTAPATVLLKASASDTDGTVAKVEYFNGATKLGETTSAPHQFSWSQPVAGSYVLTAKATDNLGGTTASAAVTLIVNAPPSVALTAPSTGTVVPASTTVSLQASATDADGTIAKVEFYRGTTRLGQSVATPFQFDWTASAAGTFAITAKATDNFGAATTSAPVSVIVNALPTVRIATPANNARFTASANINLLASASDSDGTIAKVEFFSGATKLGEALAPPYQFSWSTVSAGTYSLTARVTDDRGATATSTVVAVTVQPGATVPSVAVTSPPDGSVVTAGSPLTLTAGISNFAAAISKIELFNGATKLGDATAVSGQPNSYALTLGTGLVAGTYSLTARATDTANVVTNSAVSTLIVNAVPSVALTSPVAGAVVSAPATLSLAATASDTDGTVAKVEFFSGATKLGEATVAPFLLSVADVPAGSYALTARATDNRGAVGISSVVAITVNAPPSVALTAPVEGATVAALTDVTLVATATDSDGTVTKVEFFDRSTKLGEATVAPYTYLWTAVPAGQYQLTAKATDNLGGITTSATVTVTANAAPTVTLTSPGNNASFTGPATITLTATASDADGTVAKVEFYNGTQKLGEATAAPFQFVWADVGGGTYALTARAIDDDGSTALSAVVTVQVIATHSPPAVALTAPLDGSVISAPADLTLQATATDADGTVTKVEFFNGVTKLGEATAAPFRYTATALPSGVYTLTAKATDNLGAATTSASVQVTVNALPNVALTTPASGLVTPEPASLTLTATASDSDGTIARVEFFNGTTKLGEATSSPYQFSWTDIPAGTYLLTAKATDNLGGSKTSGATTVQVTGSNLPPTVALISPEAQATLAAPADITLRATASDSDGLVTRVDFYAGDSLVGSADTAPYQATWTAVPAGDYQLIARAYDNGGAMTDSLPISVSVTSAVAVTLTAPTTGTSFVSPALINLAAEASVPGGAVAKVSFFNGTTLIGESTTSPYQFDWSDVAPGMYSFKARASDASGVFADSTTVTVVVSAPHQPPVVALTGPVDGSTITIPASLPLAANATVPSGSITRVEFTANGTLLSRTTAAPYRYTWSLVPPGTYSLLATAYDDTGASTSSAPVNVTVVAPHGPPTVTLTDPVVGSRFSTADTVFLAANANAGNGTITKVEFYQGSTKIGEATSAPFEVPWSGLTAGTYAISARAYDDTGATASTAPVSILVGAPPSVTLTAPTVGSTLIAGAPFSLSASATTTAGTVTKVEFYGDRTLLGVATVAPYQISCEGLAGGSYALKARAYGDNGIYADSTVVSVSVSGSTPPVVALTFPEAGLTFAVGSNISLLASSRAFGGTINRVDFFRDTSFISSRYFYPWDDPTYPSGVGLYLGSVGTYAVKARAFTTAGLSADSTPITLTVTAGAPPVVSLTATPLSVSSASLAATASSNGATITKVEFYSGSTPLASAFSPPYAHVWSNIPPGAYTLKARAYDDAGGVSVSEPVTFTSYATVPLVANFESAEGYLPGSLHGQLGWTANNATALVSPSDARTGANSIVLQPSPAQGQLSQVFQSDPAKSVVFVDFFAKPVADYGPYSATIFSSDYAQIAVQLTGHHGQVFVYSSIPSGESSGSWVETPCVLPLNADRQTINWVRFTQRINYTAHTWDLYVDGRMIMADIALDPYVSQFASFFVQSHPSFLTRFDDLYIGYDNPLFADTAGDGIDDAWKLSHGIAPGTFARTIDPANSGLSVLQKYVLGLDPQKASTLDDGISDGWKVANGLNPLKPGVVNLDPFGDGLTYLQKFLLSKLTPGGGYYGGAFQDTDGDGIPDLVEYTNGSDPLDYYNGVLPRITALPDPSGFFGPQGLVSARITDAAGVPLANAPMTISVPAGLAVLSTDPANPGYSNSVEVRTDSSGIARAYASPLTP